jgi:hypothetical protein
MTDLRKIMMLSAAAHILASVPLPPVSVEYLDRQKPASAPEKRAKVKAARKQRKKP